MKSESSQQGSLFGLPIGALSHVSSYLPLPSRALFAVALNYYRETDSSTAIVGQQWDALDFGDIEKELAVKLTDDDVKGVLLSIDAVNNLKTLRLTNLLNVTGTGLEPLRGSTTIEKIDLSLVGDRESPDLSPAPPLSCTEVLPILDSIVDKGEASSLKLLVFPKKWREERNTESEFHDFLHQYDELLCSRAVYCLKCNRNLVEEYPLVVFAHKNYGTQDDTCYDCMKHYCDDCVEQEDGEEFHCMNSICDICKRRYCLNCSKEGYCSSCDKWFCVDCKDMKHCTECYTNTCLNCASKQGCRNSCCEGKIWCVPCAQNVDGNVFRLCNFCGADYCHDCYGDDFKLCEDCGEECCNTCYDNPDNVYSIDYCEDCDEDLCGKCRVIKCNGGSSCTECYRYAFPVLLKDKERQRQEMQVEIDEQKKENSELKRKLEDMIGEGQKNDEG